MNKAVVERVLELQKLFGLRGLSLSVAESCTGGLLSAWISSQAGVSSFYKGGVVSYARSVKEDILGIPLHVLQASGEVSLPTALAMAKGVRKALHSDWSVSVTGIAGPGGGSVDKPVGTVCFSVVGPGFEKALRKQFPAEKGRQDIQHQSAFFALDFLLQCMR